jgi:hypothetical protein
MKIWHSPIFDEYISGAGPFYTADRFCDPLGSWGFSLSTMVTDVAGTNPNLTIVSQHSADKVFWLDSDTLVNDLMSGGETWLSFHEGKAAYVRLKITLSGSGAAARLQLWATARCQLRIFDCEPSKLAGMNESSCGCE